MSHRMSQFASKLDDLKCKIKMHEELESPNKIFRVVVDRVMHDKDDSHNDISQIKQEPEFQKTLMSLNARKNLLIKATAKQYGITPD